MVLRTVAMPKDTNPNGDIFGGWIMSQMDMGGGLLAKEVAHGRVVTVTADKMTFVRPVKVGDTVCVYGEVIRIGHTSTDILLETWAKALVEDFRRRARSSTWARRTSPPRSWSKWTSSRAGRRKLSSQPSPAGTRS
jgi:acyl-CoA thioesterase YciA